MIIFSYDCGTRKLGFCCIEININWRADIAVIIEQINKFHANKTLNKNETITELKNILIQTEKLLDSIFKIIYMNVFDLIPNEEITPANHIKIVQSLKYLLKCLDLQLPNPDVVLIENQMKKNGKSNEISHYLEIYYMPIGIDTCLTYTLTDYPIDDKKVISKSVDKPEVYMIGCSVKNSYNIDKIDGKYSRFIMKYADKYNANKEHCNYNFKYFLRADGIILNTKESTRDVADAFMQAYAWSINKRYI